MNQLAVFHDDKLAGTITLDARGDFQFAYDDHYRNNAKYPLSQSLPLHGDIAERAAQRFFANLLPEGRIRDFVCQRLKISRENDFALLAAIGEDCAGALVIQDLARESKRPKADYKRLQPNELEALQNGHQVFAQAVQRYGLRLSLAGAQDKLAVYREGDDYFLPMFGAPSTHILKFSPIDFKQLPTNEIFTMMTARALGLRTAESRLVKQRREPFAEIERYDRICSAPTNRKKQPFGLSISRLHQEDLCQALGRPYAMKYQSEGGPSLSDCLGIVRDVSTELLEDAIQLVRWMIFNVLAGNSDAHGKNLALLYDAHPRLAPFYDLVCTRAYERLDRRLAMAIGGEYDPDLVDKTAWQREAAALSIKPSYVLEQAHDMSERFLDVASDTAKAFKKAYRSTAAIDSIVVCWRKRQRTVRRLLNEPRRAGARIKNAKNR